MAEIDFIINNLYLGGCWLPLHSPKTLIEKKITHIVSVGNEFINIKHDFECNSLNINIDDVAESAITLRDKLDEIHEQIHNARKLGNVFVHCNCGVSRSPTIIISYLMGRLNYSLFDAFYLVKKRRDIIQPNLEFMKMLINYEISLGKSSSFTLDKYMEQM